MSESYPEEPTEGEHTCPDEGDDAEVEAADSYLQIRQALDRAQVVEEMDPDWYLTDFLVVGVAESFKPEHKGKSLCFHIGPEADLPPHRILGLLKYALVRYEHSIGCCLETSEDDDEDEVG